MPASTTRTGRRKKKPPHRLAPPVPRDANGKFMKGYSGHPTGVRAIPPEIRELAREHGPAAIARLAELMRSDDGVIAIAACRELLNRGWGRPESTVSLPNGGSLVSIQLGTAPIATAEEADRAYRAILGDPAFDFSQLSFAPAPPEPMQEPTSLEPVPSAGDPPEAAPATAPVEPPNNVVDLALWERLGR